VFRIKRTNNQVRFSPRVAKYSNVTSNLAALFKKIGGATLLVALWLWLAPTAQAGLLSDSSKAHRAEVVLSHLLSDDQTTAQSAAAEVAEQSAGEGSSPDDGAPVPAAFAPNNRLTRLARHGLPPARAPPGSGSALLYNARAPPRI
jgi:hypothetical protein